MYEYLYSKEHFRKFPCKLEEHTGICEYVIICPYYHTTDINKDTICFNPEIINYYTESLFKNIDEKLKEIKYLENVIDSHKCLKCNEGLNTRYIIIQPCEHILCEKCSIVNNTNNTCTICERGIKQKLNIYII